MGDYFYYFGTAITTAVVTGAVTAAVINMPSKSSQIIPPVDLENQSLEIPNSGGTRQSHLAPVGQTTSFVYDDAKTLLEVFERGCRISDNGPCLGWRGEKPEYHWISYKEAIQRAKDIASGLVAIGMKPGQSSLVGIYAQNCVEWILTEQACYNQSAVIVALYDTLGPDACSFIINEAELRIIVCDDEEKVKSLLIGATCTPCLKQIIVIKELTDDTHQKAEDLGIKLHSFTDIESLGKQNPVPIKPCKPEDISTICYTSGTTATPKGVMLTHANILIDISASVLMLREHTPHYPDVMCSFLPLAHMLERYSETIVYINGGAVGFFRGEIRFLMEDLKVLKPTVLVAVPRVLNKIYDKVQAKVAGNRVKKLLLNLALRSKTSEIQKCIIRNNSIWDRLVFKHVREGMGGRVRFLVCGSAPLAENVITFIRCALGCIILEGYGQTECVSPCAVNVQGDYTAGQVGPPISCCHIKLADVSELGYFSSNGQGEILVKGGNVFKGYFKQPEKTAETIDEDGWLHTGDIGMWLPNGTLKIIDRKKYIFKLSQGEYIAPEKIENIYLASQFVSQIFVHGESLQSSLVAIVVPEEEIVKNWCKQKNIEGSWKEICENKIAKSTILQDINSHGKEAGLKSFEQVKDIYLHPELFTIGNGLLTPSFKTRRSDCRKYFMKQIENMYQLLA